MKKIVPSIMCADPMCLEMELINLKEAGIDWLHCDVMDGVFVNNLAMAPYILKPLMARHDFTIDIHLACKRPEHYVEMFSVIKPDYLTFHIEATANPKKLIEQIQRKGIKVGVAISPETPVKTIFPLISKVDLILIMTVNPGFAGQLFIPSVTDKIRELAKYLERVPYKPLIEVDGNICEKTIPKLAGLGVNLYVVGTAALFNKQAGSYQQKIINLGNQLVEMER